MGWDWASCMCMCKNGEKNGFKNSHFQIFIEIFRKISLFQLLFFHINEYICYIMIFICVHIYQTINCIELITCIWQYLILVIEWWKYKSSRKYQLLTSSSYWDTWRGVSQLRGVFSRFSGLVLPTIIILQINFAYSQNTHVCLIQKWLYLL